MLGSMLVRHLSQDPTYDILATLRDESTAVSQAAAMPEIGWTAFDALGADANQLERLLRGADAVVNAIGLIKQRIDEHCPDNVEQAVRINTVFSLMLARVANYCGVKLLQVATDCVYSGSVGKYDERAAHDCVDVYGKSKSLGEVSTDGVINLRCSIVGPERATGVSLLNWFLTRPYAAEIQGFTNHQWNGTTTLHFAKLCRGIISEKLAIPCVQHIVPADTVSKEELLRLFANAFGREDVTIRAAPAAETIDRTLTTIRPDVNERVWAAAGFGALPTIGEMVAELAKTVSPQHPGME